MKLGIGDRVRIRVRFSTGNVWAPGRIVGEADGRWLATEMHWTGDEWVERPPIHDPTERFCQTATILHKGRRVYALPREDVRKRRAL